ncbi:hypothetical protein KUTeg_017735 [Tegillarca granosa]|uniref:B box-type domain-containing protein n=1 Tax=Tegillarca granosa TaxID=220873 RepID=A0ABQ9EKN5_TEGGR|nr:hypothetical protein KUTeg_017735 [Tegillarca granosa]
MEDYHLRRDIKHRQKAVTEPEENSPSLQQQPLSMPQIAHSQYGIPKLYNPQGHPYQPYPYQPYTTSSSTCNVNVVQRQGSISGQKAVTEPEENSPSLQQQPLSMPQIAHSQYGIQNLYNPQGHPYQQYPYQPYTTPSSTCNVNVVQRQGSSPHCYYPANIGRIDMMQQVVSDSVNSDQTLTLEEAKTEPLAICELCEVNQYKWKCLTCSVHICEICKRAHIKSKLSSNHNVVETMATISDPIMICKEQETEMCNVHSNEKIQMFCTACKIFVCHDCIVDGLHRNHNFLKIDNVLRSKQSELTTIISKLEKKLANIVDARETLKENQKKYKDENDKLFATVRNHNQQLKNEIDKITKDITSKIQHQLRIDEGIFKQRNEQIIKLDTELTNLMTQCKEQQNETNLKLVSFVTKVKESCKNFDTDRHEFSHLHPPKFKVHPINSDDLRKLFGDLECDPEIGSDYVPN